MMRLQREEQRRQGQYSGRRVRLRNRRSRVRIPPGCKVFRNLYIAVLLS
jgi:hypothetical protein